MNTTQLEATARQIVSEGRGLLAADDSTKSTAKRFDAVKLENSETSRRDYRELLMTSPKVKDVLSGVILFEETFHQLLSTGEAFPAHLASEGVLPGIKLDQGLQDLAGFPGEQITAGLDALPDRAKLFSSQGARFVKWRNVIAIGDGIPTKECIEANTYILARYARICQDNDMVPIVEPEVLINGAHSAEDSERVSALVYDSLFETMREYRVHIPGSVLKCSMIIPGDKSGIPMDENDVAERTVRTLKAHVPKELGGVVFLSGGQTTYQSLTNLNRIEQEAKGKLPFNVTFSYLRSLQDPVLHEWAATHDREKCQALFDRLLSFAHAARNGELDEAKLKEEFSTDPATHEGGVNEY